MTDRGDPGEMGQPAGQSKGNPPLPPNRFRSTIHLTLMTAAVYLVYLVQGICIGNYFGTSAELDGFWLAMLVVTTLVALAEPFKEAAVVGVKVQELSDPAESQRTFSALLNRLLLWSLAILAAAALAAQPLATFLAPGEAGRAPRAEVFQLTLILLPLCLLQAPGILIEGYLSVQRKFLVPRFCMLIGILAAVAAIILFHQRLAVMALVLAFYVQFGVKLAGMIWSLAARGFPLQSHPQRARARRPVRPFAAGPAFGDVHAFPVAEVHLGGGRGRAFRLQFRLRALGGPADAPGQYGSDGDMDGHARSGPPGRRPALGRIRLRCAADRGGDVRLQPAFLFLAEPIVRLIYERGAFTAASVSA